MDGEAMNIETSLLLGFVTGSIATYFALISYSKIVTPAKAGGWRPLKIGRLESTADQVAVISRDVPPARPVGGHKEVYPAPVIFNASTPSVKTQEAYRFSVANDNGSTHTILLPARYITRFIAMDELKRDNWIGKATIYTDLLRVAQSRGWVEPSETKQNGYQWVREMRSIGRRVNRLMEESITLPSPARV